MKSMLYFILTILLSIITIGSVMKMTQQNQLPATDTASNSTQESTEDFWDNSETSSDEQTSEEEPEEALPMLKGLKIPENEADYIEPRLEMRTGAQLYIATDKERPQLRFSCNVAKELKEEIQSNPKKQLAMLLFPANGFDYVNPDKYTYVDWITELEKAGQTGYVLSYFEDNYQANGDDFYVAYRFENIPYKQMNNSIAALGVVITVNDDGTKTYKYSKLPEGQTYQSNARSVAYVAAASLNAYRLGMEVFTDEQLQLVQSYINESVDKANGLTAATDDGSTYEFSVLPTGPKAVTIGENFKLEVEIKPNVIVPVWYRSSDENIVTVDDNGNVMAIAKGTAVIGVYVAGESFGVTITVS